MLLALTKISAKISNKIFLVHVGDGCIQNPRNHPWQSNKDLYVPYFSRLTGLRIKDLSWPDFHFHCNLTSSNSVAIKNFDCFHLLVYDPCEFEVTEISLSVGYTVYPKTEIAILRLNSEKQTFSLANFSGIEIND